MTLDIITDPKLGSFRHGFFTRRGGVSSGIFDSLNCGRGSSDQREAVDMNRSRVAEALEATHLEGVFQVHSARVITLDAPQSAVAEADGLVTARPGLAISVLTADCQPVLFADPEARIVGAAHAGWQGALNGVLEATLDAMVAAGAVRARIVAVIGPTISQRAYEVGPEFLDRFAQEDPDSLRFFAGGQDDRSQFDLPGYGLHRLRAAGIADAGWTRHCTYSDPDRFFSYRRCVHQKQADYGRLISAICA